jgi:hypothetical protein
LPLGGLKGKPQGHVETAQKQGLGCQLAVTLWQIIEVNDVPGSQCFLAVKIQGFSLSVCRINTGGFLVEAPQHRDLLAQILQAESVPPVGEKRISKNRFLQRLKEFVAQKGELAGAGARARVLADLALREGGLTDELGALREQLVAAERRAARVAGGW